MTSGTNMTGTCQARTGTKARTQSSPILANDWTIRALINRLIATAITPDPVSPRETMTLLEHADTDTDTDTDDDEADSSEENSL